MNAKTLKVGQLKLKNNFVPLPYRCVSFQPYEGEMTTAVIEQYILPREVYRRTDIIILHSSQNEYAVVAVQRATSDTLFSVIEKLEVLALPSDCIFLENPDTDPANRSALAKLAVEHGVTPDQTAIVQGSFDHINIIHRPNPFILRVVEVVPPSPPKLFHLAEHVLSYADLPAVILESVTIDLLSLSQGVTADAFLVPCRSGGLDQLSAPVHFLDERPKQRENWTLIGCERSLQFHQHYYGDIPPRIEMCPQKLVKDNGKATLIKCCLLEFDIEQKGSIMQVPWGSDLAMIEKALKQLLKEVVDD